MSGPAAFVWDDRLRAYDFGPGHPLAPVRQQLTYRLLREFGALERTGVEVINPVEAVDAAAILRVHSPAFVDAVRQASEDQARADLRHGLGTEDVPAFAGMHDVAGAEQAAKVAAQRVDPRGHRRTRCR